MNAYDLVMLLAKYGVYTQTDEYLKGDNNEGMEHIS